MKGVFQKDDFAYSVIDEAEISQELDRSIRHALARDLILKCIMKVSMAASPN